MKYKLLVLFIVLFMTFLSNSATAGLIAYWSMDDSVGLVARDRIGGHDGELKGNPAWKMDGKTRGAIALDGDGDYIQTTLMDELKTAENFSMALWFKANVTNQGELHMIWVGSAPGNGWGTEQELHMGINHPKHHDKLVLYFGSAQDITGQCLNMVSKDDFKDTSQWHHFTAVVRNANGPKVEGKMYLDGVLIDHLAQGADLTTTNTTEKPPDRNGWNTKLRIGGPADAKRYFNGLIDEVAVWDHALTQEEIRLLVNSGVIIAVESYGKLANTWGAIKF